MPYMQYPIIEYFYDQKRSQGEDGDSLWQNILHLYFPTASNYGLVRETRSVGGRKKRGVIIRKCKADESPARIVLLETEIWKGCSRKVESYLRLVRAEQGTSTLYAIAAVGLHSRFYVMGPDDDEVSYFQGTESEPFEVKDDEAAIDALLLDLVAKTT